MTMLRRAIALIVVLSSFAIPVASLFSDWRIGHGHFAVGGYVVFALGAGISILNFYLSFVRKPLSQLLGRAAETDRPISGIPLFGMLTIPGLMLVPTSRWLSVTCVALLVADTGNLFWIVLAVWRAGVLANPPLQRTGLAPRR